MIEYRLIRSGRRTLCITVKPDGALVVRAPLFTPVKEIEAFLQQKRNWILQKQAAVSPCSFRLEEGALLPYWDGPLTVHICNIPMAMKYHGHLLAPKCDTLREVLLWRKAQAECMLKPRIDHWVQVTGLNPACVRYTNAASCWGSMSGRGTMSLSAALVHLPPDLCDYVIVHELCHMRQPNHSPAFHTLVRSFLPDADQRRQAIRGKAAMAALLTRPKP